MLQIEIQIESQKITNGKSKSAHQKLKITLTRNPFGIQHDPLHVDLGLLKGIPACVGNLCQAGSKGFRIGEVFACFALFY